MYSIFVNRISHHGFLKGIERLYFYLLNTLYFSISNSLDRFSLKSIFCLLFPTVLDTFTDRIGRANPSGLDMWYSIWSSEMFERIR